MAGFEGDATGRADGRSFLYGAEVNWKAPREKREQSPEEELVESTVPGEIGLKQLRAIDCEGRRSARLRAAIQSLTHHDTLARSAVFDVRHVE